MFSEVYFFHALTKKCHLENSDNYRMTNDILYGIISLLIGIGCLWLGIKKPFKNDPTLTNYRMIIWGIIGILFGIGFFLSLV